MKMNVKQMQPPEDKALVYVVRPSGRRRGLDVKIICAGLYIGKIKSRQFLYTILDPGNYIIFSDSGSESNTAFAGLSELELNVEAEKIYFLQVKIINQTAVIDNRIIQIVESDGRIYLDKCELSTDIDVRDLY